MLNKLNKVIGRHLLDSYKTSKLKAADNSLDHCLQAAQATPKKTKYCFLISNGSNGWSSARLVEPIVEDNFSTVWIGTNPNLRKIIEIRANPKVTLAFGNLEERANLVIYGGATVETDISLRKRYWKGEWRLFFPNGPTGEDYVLIKIQPMRMELMNFHRNVIREPFGLKPAVLTRDQGQWRLEENFN